MSFSFCAAIYADGERVWRDSKEFTCRAQFVPHIYGNDGFGRQVVDTVHSYKGKDWRLGIVGDSSNWGGYTFKNKKRLKEFLGDVAEDIRFTTIDTRRVDWDGNVIGKIHDEVEIILARPIAYLPFYIGGIVGVAREVLDNSRTVALKGSLREHSETAVAKAVMTTCGDILNCAEVPFYEWLVT